MTQLSPRTVNTSQVLHRLHKKIISQDRGDKGNMEIKYISMTSCFTILSTNCGLQLHRQVLCLRGVRGPQFATMTRVSSCSFSGVWERKVSARMTCSALI